MKVAVPKETYPDETRVAATPDSVKRLIDLGCEVVVESGAGATTAMTDDAYREAGATVAADAANALGGADIVLRVRPPTADEVSAMKPGAVLIGLLQPYEDADRLKSYANQKVTSFSLELVPRITRAQSIDVLSSQANLAGYMAVIDAAAVFGRAFPMMVTAAGTVAPARVLVLGAGVAGLQAIATAKRLGAIVSAMDVRPAAREQVESLGATFVEVESEEAEQAETAGGYAREMSEDYQRRQAELLAETLKRTDIVITTALIPGRPAPVLITDAMVVDMRQGAVIVDLAVEQGGNVEASAFGRIVEIHGVRIIGRANMLSHIAVDASTLYARNLVNFLGLMIDPESKSLNIDWEDEILQASVVTRDGDVTYPPATAEGSSS
jgi:NAD(P) transhydrogenase subunit alpha